MKNTLRVSLQTQEILRQFEARNHLPPQDVARVAISLAIRSGGAIEAGDEGGFEMERETLLGDWDSFFKALIEAREERHIEDADYFPAVVKAYLDAGARMLENEYKYASGDFYLHLAELDKGI